MSYGAIEAPKSLTRLPILAYTLPARRSGTETAGQPPSDAAHTESAPGGRRDVVMFPMTLETAPSGLVDWLLGVFNEELATGKTYPQHGPFSLEQFLSYYFNATVIIGLLVEDPELLDRIDAHAEPLASEIQQQQKQTADGSSSLAESNSTSNGVKTSTTSDVGIGRIANTESLTVEEAKGGRTWDECFLGCYYIKPNYPGRSSHNCNGGFLVPPGHRGLKTGIALGKSYLYYAPKLGYRGSVFNLVYKNNLASLAIWDRLGFSRVGLIPKAGLLKTGPDGQEEYVDAVVVFKSFVDGD